ncbi:HigA family addiction module antitoxin [Dickeya fangzhongdai]|uniref:HigA family addiction module antitoxin n=1 Tax=Dickeya fangzhongdai TaxID=1778540 RepID=UPI002B311EC7|nr:HigA family addiction module antitoxin [Dickeya fangzhongdai]
MRNAEPTTVGEMLSEEFLKPLGMSAYELADLMGITYNRIEDILKNTQKINKTEGVMLAEIFNTDSSFWINLQNAYVL